jgi:methyl coenzyme M reductase subunit C
MQMLGLSDTLDSRNLVCRMHHGEREARVHTLSVHVHRAGSALPVIAALLRAGQVQVLPQTIQQRRPRIDAKDATLPVHPQG